MLHKIIKNYYKFFDETIESSTFIVLIISMIIFLVGTLTPVANAQNMYIKANMLENFSLSQELQNTVLIDGVEYKINFSRVKK